MSIDRSLKSKATLARHRNVLTRAERVERLRELGKWSDDMTALGLPKVAHRKAAVGKKAKSAKPEGEGEGEGEAAKTEKKPS
jgi:small basic protein (TIGR04137 family)